MKWTTYTLKKLTRTQNTIGQWVNKWVDVQDIDVIVSNNLYTTVDGDVVYRVYAPIGVSKFKDFERNATYQISSSSNVYEVTSFNISGRYSQLLLKEVVEHG